MNLLVKDFAFYTTGFPPMQTQQSKKGSAFRKIDRTLLMFLFFCAGSMKFFKKIRR